MELYKHNREHYDALMAMLETGQRACGIQPPGTGKSFIAFNIALEHPGESMLWMSPNEYIFSEQMESFKRNCPGDDVSNIEQMTYAAAMARAKDGRELPCGFDWIVLDEFHHCLAPEWGKGVQAVLDANPQAKIVGLTATEIRWFDGERDAAEELFGGNVAFRMGLEEAWLRGILPIPKYVTALYERPPELDEAEKRADSLRRWPSKMEAYSAKFEELRRAVASAKGVGDVMREQIPRPDAKLVVFCPNIPSIDEICDLRRDWFGGVNEDIHAYIVHSMTPDGDESFKSFREDRSRALKLLFCVDQLNEGVHISGLDGVVMVRPTASPTIFVQQMGRALDAGGERCPLVIDLVNNLTSLGFGTIRETLRGQYARMAEEASDEIERTPEDFVIVDETQEARRLVEELKAFFPNGDRTSGIHYGQSIDEMIDWLVEYAKDNKRGRNKRECQA